MHPDGEMTYVGRARWRLFTHEEVVSTNDHSRGLPAWSAVCAARQTGGRGRFGRSFVSDEGGLWLSAVLPSGGEAARWTGFSLMVGNHLLRLLRRLGLAKARLRWPNDLMVGQRKLAGLLIEQGSRETLTVGLGLNVRNTPWDLQPSLRSTATRLADLLAVPPALPDLAVSVLDALAEAHADMLQGGLPAAIAEFNANCEPGMVEITLVAHGTVRGHFFGLDQEGSLRLTDPDGNLRIIAHSQVERLTEE